MVKWYFPQTNVSEVVCLSTEEVSIPPSVMYIHQRGSCSTKNIFNKMIHNESKYMTDGNFRKYFIK